MLQNNKSIDDSKSGTTCIGALFVDGKVYVSNVGDSRAVLAQGGYALTCMELMMLCSQ